MIWVPGTYIITTCFVTFHWWELKKKKQTTYLILLHKRQNTGTSLESWRIRGQLVAHNEDNALAGHNQNCYRIPSSWSKEASLYKSRGFSLSFGFCFFASVIVSLFLWIVWWNNCTFIIMSNTTVTLPKPTVARRSVSKKRENRATSADCRPTSAPILENFVVGRRLFLSKHLS